MTETPAASPSPGIDIDRLFSTPPDAFTNETITLIISELRRYRLAYLESGGKTRRAKAKPEAAETEVTTQPKPEKLTLADLSKIDIE